MISTIEQQHCREDSGRGTRGREDLPKESIEIQSSSSSYGSGYHRNQPLAATAVSIMGESTTTITSTNSGCSMRRNVSFDTVDIREYGITLSDNPACTSGPPVQLGWKYSNEVSAKVEEYESIRSNVRRTKEMMQIPPNIRDIQLREDAGYSRKEILQMSKEVKKIQASRERHANESPLKQRRDEFLETAHKSLTGYKRKEKVLLKKAEKTTSRETRNQEQQQQPPPPPPHPMNNDILDSSSSSLNTKGILKNKEDSAPTEENTIFENDRNQSAEQHRNSLIWDDNFILKSKKKSSSRKHTKPAATATSSQDSSVEGDADNPKNNKKKSSPNNLLHRIRVRARSSSPTSTRNRRSRRLKHERHRQQHITASKKMSMPQTDGSFPSSPATTVDLTPSTRSLDGTNEAATPSYDLLSVMGPPPLDGNSDDGNSAKDCLDASTRNKSSNLEGGVVVEQGIVFMTATAGQRPPIARSAALKHSYHTPPTSPTKKQPQRRLLGGSMTTQSGSNCESYHSIAATTNYVKIDNNILGAPEDHLKPSMSPTKKVSTSQHDRSRSNRGRSRRPTVSDGNDDESEVTMLTTNKTVTVESKQSGNQTKDAALSVSLIPSKLNRKTHRSQKRRERREKRRSRRRNRSASPSMETTATISTSALGRGSKVKSTNQTFVPLLRRIRTRSASPTVQNRRKDNGVQNHNGAKIKKNATTHNRPINNMSENGPRTNSRGRPPLMQRFGLRSRSPSPAPGAVLARSAGGGQRSYPTAKFLGAVLRSRSPSPSPAAAAAVREANRPKQNQSSGPLSSPSNQLKFHNALQSHMDGLGQHMTPTIIIASFQQSQSSVELSLGGGEEEGSKDEDEAQSMDSSVLAANGDDLEEAQSMNSSADDDDQSIDSLGVRLEI